MTHQLNEAEIAEELRLAQRTVCLCERSYHKNLELHANCLRASALLHLASENEELKQEVRRVKDAKAEELKVYDVIEENSKLRERAEAAEARVKQHEDIENKYIRTLEEDVSRLEKERAAAVASNAGLRQALEYYAHPDHYEDRITLAGNRGPGVMRDLGHTARKALSALTDDNEKKENK